VLGPLPCGCVPPIFNWSELFCCRFIGLFSLRAIFLPLVSIFPVASPDDLCRCTCGRHISCSHSPQRFYRSIFSFWFAKLRILRGSWVNFWLLLGRTVFPPFGLFPPLFISICRPPGGPSQLSRKLTWRAVFGRKGPLFLCFSDSQMWNARPPLLFGFFSLLVVSPHTPPRDVCLALFTRKPLRLFFFDLLLPLGLFCEKPACSVFCLFHRSLPPVLLGLGGSFFSLTLFGSRLYIVGPAWPLFG